MPSFFFVKTKDPWPLIKPGAYIHWTWVLVWPIGQLLRFRKAALDPCCPSAKVVSTGRLHGFRLAFAGHSVTRGGAGVATVVGDPYGWVSGAVYSITRADLQTLDRCEGHPFAYKRTPLPIDLLDLAEETEAFVYIKEDEENLPTEDYALQILRGYQEHGLDFDPLLEALERARACQSYWY